MTTYISDLPIPTALKEFYIADKITALYPPQEEVVAKGLFRGNNLLISIPTASGKTLMAELAMLTGIIEQHGKALYIVPLKALASEKHDRFCRFAELKGYTITTAISTGDFKSKGEKLAESDIIVITSEKADSLIRNKAPWFDQISVVVIDEIHLVGDKDRGATLEMVIAKLKRLNPKIRMIGLSATIGNPGSLAKWLKAELIVSEWRPTKLKEGVFYNNKILFGNEPRIVNIKNKDDSNALVIDMVLEGGQALVFCGTRKITESKARNVTKELYLLLDSETRAKLETLSANITDEDSKTTVAMMHCISHGAAFHHAGLAENLRKAVESGFRDGLIKVIYCTPTLAAGLNLPARRVIIQGYKRYTKEDGSRDIRVMDYKQMAGRAGRPHLDPYGECVLVPIGQTEQESERIVKVFIQGSPEEIYSSFLNIKHLQIHILASVASGFVNSVKEFNDLLNETFLPYYSTTEEVFIITPKIIEANILQARNYLITEKMIIMDTHGMLAATPLGMIISRLCLNPTTGAIIRRGLDEIESAKITVTDMTLLHLIALTDDITHYYKTADNEIILQVFHAHEKELVKLKELIPRQFSNAGDVSDPIKFADILRQWITEIKEPIIADDWGVGEGDVHSIVEQSKRVASALYMIAELQKNDSITTLARVLSVRINKGIKTELIGLTKIKGIGRAYARRLYNAKIATEQKYNELKSSDPELIKSILHPKKDKPALKIPIPTSDAASKKKLVRINEQVLLSSYGKHPTGAK